MQYAAPVKVVQTLAALASICFRHVKFAVERFQAEELDAFEVDEVIFQYSRAAKELWKFCSLGDIEIAARIVRDDPPLDWWERGARRRR